MQQSSAMVSHQISTVEEESAFLLDDIFRGDKVAESVCLRDLVQWAGENPITLSRHDLTQLVVYSEEKLRELRDIYYELSL